MDVYGEGSFVPFPRWLRQSLGGGQGAESQPFQTPRLAEPTDIKPLPVGAGPQSAEDFSGQDRRKHRLSGAQTIEAGTAQRTLRGHGRGLLPLLVGQALARRDADAAGHMGAGGDDLAVEGVDEGGDGGAGAAGDLLDGGQALVGVAGVDALGAVAEVEVVGVVPPLPRPLPRARGGGRS